MECKVSTQHAVFARRYAHVRSASGYAQRYAHVRSASSLAQQYALVRNASG